jgi:hypothetical protein
LRSVCQVCEEEIISNLTGEVWYHLAKPSVRGRATLQQGLDKPRLHRADPGDVEHTCPRPDPSCPFCDQDEARRWLEARLAEAEDRPMPGLT